MSHEATILVVEDDEITRSLFCKRLEAKGYTVIPEADGRAALDRLRTTEVDLVLMDIVMPRIGGLEALEEIRSSWAATELPVIMVTSKESSSEVVRALRLGANDYVTKSLDFEVILARVRTQLSLRQLMLKVEEMAIRDELTRVYNRRGFYELALKTISQASRYDAPLQALMIDIDHFKRINDTHGHRGGDEVLREVASRCLAELRDSDIFARWGGEEFVAVLPNIDLAGGERSAERIREVVASAPVETSKGPVAVTLSIGVASYTEACKTLEDLMGLVDYAMYEAKNRGRNQVAVFGKRSTPHKPSATDPQVED